MYERKKDKLAPRRVFYKRQVYNLFVATMLLSCCLVIGIIGYHFTAHVSWIDALHNAAMILSGMGPVVEIKDDTGKLFSAAYALFSGVAFITNIGILLAPAAHRLLHKFHIQDS